MVFYFNKKIILIMKSLKVCFSLLFVLSLLFGCGKSENKTSENNSTDQNSGIKSETEQIKNLTEEQAEIIEIKLPTNSVRNMQKEHRKCCQKIRRCK